MLKRQMNEYFNKKCETVVSIMKNKENEIEKH
jgi:hypothetical protein